MIGDDPFDCSPFEAQQLADAQRRREWERLTEDQVRAKVRALDGHPMRDAFGRMLAAAVQRHCPVHLPAVPLEWFGVQPASNDNQLGGTAA